MVLPFHRLILDVSRQLSSGSPPSDASIISVVRSLSADVVRIDWTFLRSVGCEQCLARH